MYLAPLVFVAVACSGQQQVPKPNVDPARFDTHIRDAPAFERRIAPFPVADSAGRPLELAFLGGLNNPRPQLVDIDGDGDLDLFIQEITGRVMLLERDGTAEGLPRFRFVTDQFGGLDVGEWYRFADLDGDGDFDLLAERQYSYLTYYRNDGTPRVPKLVLAVDTLRDAAGVPIFSDRQNIPQLGDIDCNGLPDLLVGKLDGTVTRYEATPGRGLEAPVFRLLAEQFEDIRIIGQQGSLHGANTMALVDADGDGDPDLFWGDFFEPGLLFLENTGTCAAPNLRNQPVQFPQGNPVLTSGYNAPTFGDVSGDGRLDLVMGVLGGAFNPVRTAAANLYLLEQTGERAWLVRTRQLLPMVDVGSESIPSFVDWDGDGDLDLLLANKIDPSDGRTAVITWLENVGTAPAPAFRMRGALPIRGNYHYAPAFGDLDGDGKADMLLGQWMSRVAYYRGGTGEVTLVDSAFVTITRGSNTTPALGDLDGDGDLDLLVGEASGSLNYYRNDGTRTQPRFTLVSDEWEGLRLGRRSAPALADLDGDGDLDLLVGWELTGVVAFRNDGSRTEARFVKEPWFTLPVSALAAPAVGDVDGDGAPDILVGNVGGGVVYFDRAP
jgi:hypothetical protein